MQCREKENTAEKRRKVVTCVESTWSSNVDNCEYEGAEMLV